MPQVLLPLSCEVKRGTGISFVLCRTHGGGIPAASSRMSRSEPILPWVRRYLRPYRGRVAAEVTVSSFQVLFRVCHPGPRGRSSRNSLTTSPTRPGPEIERARAC